MRFGYWMPVFGGWLRNDPDEGPAASWEAVRDLTLDALERTTLLRERERERLSVVEEDVDAALLVAVQELIDDRDRGADDEAGHQEPAQPDARQEHDRHAGERDELAVDGGLADHHDRLGRPPDGSDGR